MADGQRLGSVPRAAHNPPPDELLALGAALKLLRDRRDLKQIEVATNAGLTESQVSDIERGKNNPGWLLVMRLLNDGLGLGLADLAAAYEQVGERAAGNGG